MVVQLLYELIIEDLIPGVLEGKIQPGHVFDLTLNLSEIAEGYTAMDEREAIKVMIEF